MDKKCCYDSCIKINFSSILLWKIDKFFPTRLNTSIWVRGFNELMSKIKYHCCGYELLSSIHLVKWHTSLCHLQSVRLVEAGAQCKCLMPCVQTLVNMQWKWGFQRENYAKAHFARRLYTGCDAREQQLRPILKKATWKLAKIQNKVIIP